MRSEELDLIREGRLRQCVGCQRHFSEDVFFQHVCEAMNACDEADDRGMAPILTALSLLLKVMEHATKDDLDLQLNLCEDHQTLQRLHTRWSTRAPGLHLLKEVEG